MTISGFVAYVKQAWKNKPDTSTPLSAARLTHVEDGVKGNSNAIEKIAAAVVSQIVNDPNKIASTAALYSVNKKADDLNSDLQYFKSYYTVTGASVINILPGLQEIYAGIPENCVFDLMSAFSGTLVHLTGLKSTNQYGVINAESYADGANKRYDVLNGAWIEK